MLSAHAVTRYTLLRCLLQITTQCAHSDSSICRLISLPTSVPMPRLLKDMMVGTSNMLVVLVSISEGVSSSQEENGLIGSTNEITDNCLQPNQMVGYWGKLGPCVRCEQVDTTFTFFLLFFPPYITWKRPTFALKSSTTTSHSIAIITSQRTTSPFQPHTSSYFL